jgi:hypothetical protein
MLGGFQYAANQSLPFVTSAGITFATVIGTLMITRHPAFASPVKRTERRQPPGAFAIKPWVFVLLFTAVLFMGASFQATRFISLFVTEVAGRSAAELGTFFSLLTGLYALTFRFSGGFSIAAGIRLRCWESVTLVDYSFMEHFPLPLHPRIHTYSYWRRCLIAWWS